MGRSVAGLNLVTVTTSLRARGFRLDRATKAWQRRSGRTDMSVLPRGVAKHPELTCQFCAHSGPVGDRERQAGHDPVSDESAHGPTCDTLCSPADGTRLPAPAALRARRPPP